MLPIMDSFISMAGWAPFESTFHLDIDPITIFLVINIWAAGLFSYNLLENIPIARRLVFDELQEALFVMDMRWRIVDMNFTAQNTIAKPVEKVMGHPLQEFIPEISSFLYSETKDQQLRELTLQVEGVIHFYSINLTPLRDQNAFSDGWMLMLTDITLLKRAEDQFKYAGQISETLRKTGQVLSSTLDFDELLDQLLSLVEQVIPYDSGHVSLVEGQRVRVKRIRGYDEYGDVLRQYISTLEFGLDEYPNVSWLYQNKRSLIIPDVSAYPGWVRTGARKGTQYMDICSFGLFINNTRWKEGTGINRRIF